MNLQVKFSEGTEAFNGKLDEDDLSVRAGFGETQNLGTTKHNELSNRNLADQHPITAITGLEEALAEKLPASDFVLGTTKGTAYEGSAGQKNADDIAFVKQVLIENGTISKIEVEQAYTSRVTAHGENIVDGQKTPVTLIKGSTKRCENLFPYPYGYPSGTVQRGITFDYDEQGVFTINGTASATAQIYLLNAGNSKLKAGTYTISIVGGGSSSTYDLEIERRSKDTDTWVWGNPVTNTPKTFTLNEDEYLVVYMRVYSGYNASNKKVYVMLNEGSTALDWQPIFTDLKHAKINSIVSTGRNLLDISKLVGSALVDNGDGTYTMTKNGTTHFSKRWKFDTPLLIESVRPYAEFIENTTSGKTIAIRCFNKRGENRTIGLNNEWGQYNPGDIGEIVAMDLYLNSTLDDGAYIKFKNPRIIRSTLGTDVEYTPFIQETYQLPETLDLGEWDSFNPQTGEITRGTGRYEITGEENWIYSTTQRRFEAYLVANPTVGNPSIGTFDVVCSHFKTATAVGRNGVWIVGGSDHLPMRIIDSGFSTADELKEYLKAQYANGTPVTIEYILLTPTVEKLENAPKSYTAYNQGNEAIVGENEEFGAIPTLTNEYFKLKES